MDKHNRTRLMRKFEIKEVAHGSFGEGFFDGMETAEKYFEKQPGIFISRSEVVEELQSENYKLTKENKKLILELKKADKVIEQMSENVETWKQEELNKAVEDKLKKMR